MKVFSYTPGDSDIAIFSLLRGAPVDTTDTIYSEIVPVRNRDIGSIVAIGDGTLSHLKLYLECFTGAYLESISISDILADNVNRVVLPAKYHGIIGTITSVMISGDATDYYSGGSVDIETGVITLGTSLPYAAPVTVVFEAYNMAASAKELQTAFDASKAVMVANDSNEIWEINETTAFSKYMDFNPPMFPFIRIKVVGQSDNTADTTLTELLLSGVMRTKTS